MGSCGQADLRRLASDLKRARRALIDATQALSLKALDSVVDDTGWTRRRLIEYCRAAERRHFSRVYNFFDPEIEVYDTPAVSLDHVAPERVDRSLARECAEVWLAGRETEMWLYLIQDESLDSIRHASRHWPQGGWTIRGVFEKVTNLYREKVKTLRETSPER